MITTEPELAAVCLSLLGRITLTNAERELAKRAQPGLFHNEALRTIRQGIRSGGDPLGEAFLALRSAGERRSVGAVYTPDAIVNAMVDWVAANGTPARLVDPGAGSGRFLIAAARKFPEAQLLAVECDPLAALLLRANLAVCGLHKRAEVKVQDYREVELAPVAGSTAFIGNPPYVRHHAIDEVWKRWYVSELAGLGIKGSALAGLHLHFFLKTALLAKEGDLGAFITSAEWLDVNYGSALRQLLLTQLSAVALQVLKPTLHAFPGTATTAAVTCFKASSPPPAAIRVRSVSRVSQLSDISKGRNVSRNTLSVQARWSTIITGAKRSPTVEGIELGELFRVHRGQVTGANDVWIAGEHSSTLPEAVLFPSVTKAKDLIEAGHLLDRANDLRRVIDIPPDLDLLGGSERRRVSAFLSWAKSMGADNGYVAKHRKQWWSVGLRSPAPILCTYMARRPPQFTLNHCEARHINIAHGLYPREEIPAATLSMLVTWLNKNVSTAHGRVYSGGLTKFEPREVERLIIPPEALGR